VHEVEQITQLPQELILDDFRKVHQAYGDSEHPYSLLETDFALKLTPSFSKDQRKSYFDRAFYAFNSERKRSLKLYDGVMETFESLSQDGVDIVAYTEANLFAAVDRIDRLGVEKYFSQIYCKNRSVSKIPNYKEKKSNWASNFPMKKVIELSAGERKPNKKILQQICKDRKVSTDGCIYVGDSISRDIIMANDAGVVSAWAKYGASLPSSSYKKLVRISHWTEEDIKREINLKKVSEGVEPNLTLEKSFSEILMAFQG